MYFELQKILSVAEALSSFVVSYVVDGPLTFGWVPPVVPHCQAHAALSLNRVAIAVSAVQRIPVAESRRNSVACDGIYAVAVVPKGIQGRRRKL